MAKHGKILVIDDNKAILDALSILLRQHFEEVFLSKSPDRILDMIKEDEPDVVLLDMNFRAPVNSGNEGLYHLGQVHEKYPELPVVMFTAYADINLAVEALKRGATDFVVKPWDNDKLVATLGSAYKLHLSRTEVKQLKEINSTLSEASPQMFWGGSRAMQELKDMVGKVAATDANILITGENGTGKEVLAMEVHRLSLRSERPMVSIDMGAIVDTLFESELFGHVKGAFTDAKTDRAGKFEAASGGTLFLDEIGNLPLHLQSKLLTVLQRGVVTRVGGNKETKIDVRLICATNKDLDKLVEEGSFREDLLYRINTIHLSLPPLRERPRDIVPMAQIFLDRYARKYGKTSIRGFSSDACKEMTSYPWNGNIRELQHSIERAVILCDGDKITSSSLSLKPAKAKPHQATTLEQMESDMIEEAIQRHRGNMSAVAEQLGISRPTLYAKIKKYGL